VSRVKPLLRVATATAAAGRRPPPRQPQAAMVPEA